MGSKYSVRREKIKLKAKTLIFQVLLVATCYIFTGIFTNNQMRQGYSLIGEPQISTQGMCDIFYK